MGWEKPVSMEMDDESKLDSVMPIPMSSKPDFPFGLRISLTDKELSKLGLDADCENGEYLNMWVSARVTSVNKSETGSRVELQIEEIALDDDKSPGDD